MLSPGQTIATCQRNMSQHCWAQHVALAMLRSFGRGFTCTFCTALSQSQSSNFFMYIISRLINAILPYCQYEPIVIDGICHPLLFIIISTIFLLNLSFFLRVLKMPNSKKVETVAIQAGSLFPGGTIRCFSSKPWLIIPIFSSDYLTKQNNNNNSNSNDPAFFQTKKPYCLH